MNLSTEFVQAVKLKDLAAAAFMIKQGADIHLRVKDGNTVLHLATGNGDLDMVKMLVGNGADVLAQNSQGKTPREMARPFKQGGAVLTDDSFNRMLGSPTQDDLERKHAALLDYLVQQELLSITDMEQKTRGTAEKTRQNLIHLKNQSDKNRFKLR